MLGDGTGVLFEQIRQKWLQLRCVAVDDDERAHGYVFIAVGYGHFRAKKVESVVLIPAPEDKQGAVSGNQLGPTRSMRPS